MFCGPVISLNAKHRRRTADKQLQVSSTGGRCRHVWHHTAHGTRITTAAYVLPWPPCPDYNATPTFNEQECSVQTHCCRLAATQHVTNQVCGLTVTLTQHDNDMGDHMQCHCYNNFILWMLSRDSDISGQCYQVIARCALCPWADGCHNIQM